MRRFSILLVAVVLLVGLSAVPARSQAAVLAQLPPPNSSVTEAEAAADRAFSNRDWLAAIRAYEAITQVAPANARAWFQLGASLHEAGEYTRAAAAHLEAATRGFNPAALANFRAARAFTRAGNIEKAITTLETMVAGGFSNVQALETHPDLAALRADARFPGLLNRARINADPCNNNPAYRQLDFWVGTWEVQQTGSPKGTPGFATNVIEKLLGGCALWENWQPPQAAGQGKGLHVFNAALGQWEQKWVTASGNVVNFHGELKNGKMEYTTESTRPDGTKVTRITRIYPIAKDTVRQHSDQTTDGGKTWTPVFDLTYYRQTEKTGAN